MGRFIRCLILFCLPLLLVNAGFQYLVASRYYRPYQPGPGYRQFRTFLLADSHGAALGHYPRAYGVFNFSQPSDSYEDMYRKLRFLIGHSNISAVLLTADDHLLSPYRELRNNAGRSVRLLSARDVLRRHRPAELKAYFLDYYAVLLQASTRDFVHLYLTSNLFSRARPATRPAPATWTENDSTARVSADRLRLQFRYGRASANMRASLVAIIALCRRHHIALTAVKFPLTSAYRRALGTRSFGADSLLAAYGVPVLDYRNRYAADSLFRDPDHLNITGGRQFTRLLLGQGAAHRQAAFPPDSGMVQARP